MKVRVPQEPVTAATIAFLDIVIWACVFNLAAGLLSLAIMAP